MEMQTTATFDQDRDEWIIHTPTTLAQKYWITNSAVHAKFAVVFAQMLIGATNHGIHGFLVRIRGEVSLAGHEQGLRTMLEMNRSKLVKFKLGGACAASLPFRPMSTLPLQQLHLQLRRHCTWHLRLPCAHQGRGESAMA